MNLYTTPSEKRDERPARTLLGGLTSCFPAVPPAQWRAIGILAVVSAAVCGLWALRVITQQRIHFLFLPWNLFLAWLPLGFAVASRQLFQQCGRRSWWPWLAAAGWLAFFPNAPYIFTDLEHLRRSSYNGFWMDLIMILLFAWPGFLVGCVSLRVLHVPVASRLGSVVGWAFAGGACVLAGVGVYIGRFLRWNSWDVVTHPVDLGFDLLGFASHPGTHSACRFSLVFGILLFFGYVTTHSMPGPLQRHPVPR